MVGFFDTNPEMKGVLTDQRRTGQTTNQTQPLECLKGTRTVLYVRVKGGLEKGKK